MDQNNMHHGDQSMKHTSSGSGNTCGGGCGNCKDCNKCSNCNTCKKCNSGPLGISYRKVYGGLIVLIALFFLLDSLRIMPAVVTGAIWPLLLMLLGVAMYVSDSCSCD